MSRTDVLVVGAGPYGLAVAAHLAGRGVDHRVLGRSMGSWVDHMPAGMFLKSEAFASTIGDPAGTHTIEAYMRAHGLEYQPVGTPVPRDLFVAYGRWFQQHHVPGVEPVDLVRLERAGTGFAAETSAGETIECRAAVLAVGLVAGAVVPEGLRDRLGDRVSHASAYASLDGFAGQRVAVIGGGQSALESAALLREAGAAPTLLVRAPRITWAGRPVPRTRWQELRTPQTPLGPDLKLWLYWNGIEAYRLFPAGWRRGRGWWAPAGPEGSWWLRERVEGIVPTQLAHDVVGARLVGHEVVLEVESPAGAATLPFDHVLAATGYRFAVDTLGFLGERLRGEIRTDHGGPRLSGSLASTAQGLYFAGAAATDTFGPAMRFVFGSGFAGRRIARAIAQAARARSRGPGGGGGSR